MFFKQACNLFKMKAGRNMTKNIPDHEKRTGTDQTLSKSLFSYIVYIYIPTPNFSSQATTQSVLHLPVYTMTIHLIQSLPLSPTVAP